MLFFYAWMSTAAVHITTSQLRVCRKKKDVPKELMATSGGMDMQPESKNTFIYKKYSKVKTHPQLVRYRPKRKKKQRPKQNKTRATTEKVESAFWMRTPSGDVTRTR